MFSPCTIREKAEKEAAERAKQVEEESDDGVVVSKVKYMCAVCIVPSNISCGHTTVFLPRET